MLLWKLMCIYLSPCVRIFLTLGPVYLAKDTELCILIILFVINSHAPDQNKPSATSKHLCSQCQVCTHSGWTCTWAIACNFSEDQQEKVSVYLNFAIKSSSCACTCSRNRTVTEKGLILHSQTQDKFTLSDEFLMLLWSVLAVLLL